MAVNFRRINVDQYDLDGRLTAEDLIPKDYPVISINDENKISSEIKNLLSRGDYSSALKLGLSNPPYGNSDSSAKNSRINIIIEILSSIKSLDISRIVKSLSTDEKSLLLKYIYKGMDTVAKGDGSDYGNMSSAAAKFANGPIAPLPLSANPTGASVSSSSSAAVSSGILLAWFEKLTSDTGMGVIPRVISDRRTV